VAILKYGYLSLGLVLYVLFNIASYTMPTFQGEIAKKILFSGISFIFLMLDYIVILKTEWLFKKPFQSFTTYTKAMLYLGIIIAPLISLYYQS
jgi:hypothetical protein